MITSHAFSLLEYAFPLLHTICDKLRVEDRCQGKYDKDLGRIAELLCFKEIIKGHKLQ